MQIKLSDKEKEMGQLSLAAYLGVLDSGRTDEPLDSGLQEKLHSDMQDHLKKIGLENHEISWGPAIIYGLVGNFPAAYMFITKVKNENEYTVVIRGTNPISLYSWIVEDLSVTRQVEWDECTGNKKKNRYKIKISHASSNAVKIHSELKAFCWFYGADKSNYGYKNYTFCQYLNECVFSYLGDKEKITLNFTGHSLGGTMASTLAQWFYDTQPDIAKRCDINVYALACPTAGNKEFAELVETTFHDSLKVYLNDSDGAAHAWSDLNAYQKKLWSEAGMANVEMNLLQQVPPSEQKVQDAVRSLSLMSSIDDLQKMYAQLEPKIDIPPQKLLFEFDTSTYAGKIIWIAFYCIWQHIVSYAVAFSSVKCSPSELLKPFIVFDPKKNEINDLSQEQVTELQKMFVAFLDLS